MPDNIDLPARSLPVEHYDVLVAGGGPAGCTAAIAAARDGAKTLLVEQFNCLGGMGTAGLVPAWCPFSDGKQVIYRGLALEIFNELKAQMPHVPKEKVDWVAIDPEKLKVIYDRRVTESGATVRFQTQLVNLLTKNGVRPRFLSSRVTHAIIANKAGLTAVAATVFVDATGDADLAARAGAPCELGDPATHQQQPTTLCFTLAGIDVPRFQAWREEPGAGRHGLRPVIAEAKKNGDLHIPDHSANIAWQSNSTLGFNFSHVFDVNGVDPAALSQAMIEGRRLAFHLADFIRRYCPGCENAVVAQTGIALGVRETRRIVGDYTLTLDDYLARRSFPDEIGRNAYYLDIHKTVDELTRSDPRETDWKERGKAYGPGESHGIPYRCLLPQGLTNVLVAGRSISCDRAVQGSVRVMPPCLVMGEAAGAAAAMALRSNGDVRTVDVQALRDRLRTAGAYLP